MCIYTCALCITYTQTCTQEKYTYTCICASKYQIPTHTFLNEMVQRGVTAGGWVEDSASVLYELYLNPISQMKINYY